MSNNAINNKYGKLYLVPTPIGNLEDITLRAINTLKNVDLILAEDTRTSSFLLKHYQITTHMESHHKFNEHKNTDSVCQKLMMGKNIALISDAGSPAISDPGFFLVRRCIEKGIGVEALPGATAFVPALTASGLPTDRFTFEGFLPPKKGRETKLKEIAENDCTTIIYESPYRLIKTLEQLKKYVEENRIIVVCRELTKIHSEYKRGTLDELIEWYSVNTPKGEIVIVIEGKRDREKKGIDDGEKKYERERKEKDEK